MSSIQTSAVATGFRGAGLEQSFTYVGLGTEGNSFAYPALVNKSLIQVSRQGRTLSITAGAAPGTLYIQYTPNTTLFTLSVGDVVGAGEIFVFYYQ